MLTEQDVLEQLRTAVRAAGNQQAYAAQIGISGQYLSDVLRGRREIGSKILDVLGLEKVVSYRPKQLDPGA